MEADFKENRTIYITQNSYHDYNSVTEYGSKKVFLTEGKINVFRTDELTEKLRQGLKPFNKDDLLAFSGNSVSSAIALSILMTKFNSISILIYNAHSKEYVERVVALPSLDLKR